MSFVYLALVVLLQVLHVPCGPHCNHQAYTEETCQTCTCTSSVGATLGQETDLGPFTSSTETTSSTLAATSFLRSWRARSSCPFDCRDGEADQGIVEVCALRESAENWSPILPILRRRLGELSGLPVPPTDEDSEPTWWSLQPTSELSGGGMGECIRHLVRLEAQGWQAATEVSKIQSPQRALSAPRTKAWQTERQGKGQGKEQVEADGTIMADSGATFCTSPATGHGQCYAHPGAGLAEVVDRGFEQECRLSSDRSAEPDPRCQYQDDTVQHQADGWTREGSWKGEGATARGFCSQRTSSQGMERFLSGSCEQMDLICRRLHQRGHGDWSENRGCQGKSEASQSPAEQLQGEGRGCRGSHTNRFLRRRADRSHGQGGQRQCETGPDQHVRHIGNYAAAGCPPGGSRYPGREKKEEGCQPRQRQRRGRCLYAIYFTLLSMGRHDATSWCTWQRPEDAVVRKWLHSTTLRSDFVSTWGAAWSAFLDAGPYQRALHATPWIPPEIFNGTSSRRSARGKCAVNFADNLELLVGCSDDSSSWACIELPHAALYHWPEKPWGSTFTHGDPAPLSVLAVSSPPCQTDLPSDIGVSPAPLPEIDECAALANEITSDDDEAIFMQRPNRAPWDNPFEDPAAVQALQDAICQMQGAQQAALATNGSSGAASSSMNAVPNFPLTAPTVDSRADLLIPRTPLPNALVTLRNFMHDTGVNYAGDRPQQLITWYLNHDRYRRCIRYRIVTLHRDPRRWPRQIVNKWRDLTVPDEPYQFILVRPNPPGFELGDHLPTHLILQQQPRPEERSILLTGALPSHTPGLLYHWATVLPHHATKLHVVSAAGAEPFCQPLQDDRRSQIWRGERLYTHQEIFEVTAGQNYILVVNTVQQSAGLPDPVQTETDDVWLMQGPVAPSALHRPSHHSMSWQAQIRQLFPERTTFSCDLAADAVSFRTWYIDHDTHRHCFEDRTWVVSGAAWEWEIQLRRLWYDLVDPLQTLRISVTCRESGPCHVLLIQGPLRFAGALLFSPPTSRSPGHPIELAVSTFSTSRGAHLVRLAGLSQVCTEDNCEILVDSHPVGLMNNIDIADGAFVRVHLRDDSKYSEPIDNEIDAFSLMARGISSQPAVEDPALIPTDDIHEASSDAPSEAHFTDDAADLPIQAVWHSTVLFRVGTQSILDWKNSIEILKIFTIENSIETWILKVFFNRNCCLKLENSIEKT